MSNYGKWFDNTGYDSGYDGTGKRKFDDFSYGNRSGAYSSSFGEMDSYSIPRGAGTSNRGGGGGRGGDSGGGRGRGSGRGRGRGSGVGRGRGSGGVSEYEKFKATQHSEMNEMSKKLRKMEMMQEIADLEKEDEEEDRFLVQKLETLKQQKRMREQVCGGMFWGGSFERGRFGEGMSYGGGYGSSDNYGSGGYSGVRSLMDIPMGGGYGRGMGYGRDMGYGNYGRGMGYDWHGGIASGGLSSGGRVRKRGKKGNKNKPAKTEESEVEIDRKTGHPKPKNQRDPIDYEGRDGRLEMLIEKIKDCEDKPTESSTLHSCIHDNDFNIDVYYHQKSATLFLDGLYFGQGLEKPNKQFAFKEAIQKLRTLTLDKIKEEAIAIGTIGVLPPERDYPRPPADELKGLACPMEFAELPFVKRLEMLAEELKKYEHFSVALKIYCTKYMINLISVYHRYPGEEVDPHEYKVYANEVYLTTVRGPVRRRAEYESLKNVQEIFRTKTIEEIMENDNRFSQDYPEYPMFVSYHGIGDQIDSNAFRLRFFMDVQDFDTIKDTSINDIVLIEKNIWKGARFRILDESATFCRMLLKLKWCVEIPGEDPNDKNGKPKERKMGKIFDAGKKRDVDLQAQREKAAILYCTVYLQGEEIGSGFGVTRNRATRMACNAAYFKLLRTQTSFYHTDQIKTFHRDCKYVDLVQRAEELREKQPEAPMFEPMERVRVHQGKDDQEEEMDTNYDSEFTIKKEDVKTEEEEDELAPWVKEVLRKDMEELSVTGLLVDGGMMYRSGDIPQYVWDTAGHYSATYKIQFKSRFENRKLIGLFISKKTQNIYELAQKLAEAPGKKAHGYTMQQIRKPNGIVQVVNKVDTIKGVRRRYVYRK